MSFRKRSLLFLLMAALTFTALFLAWPVGGGLRAREKELSDNLAVVLVIDVSGSMEQTDPGRLRERAGKMFIDLLGVEDYLGLIVFDQQPELVASLQLLGGAARKDELMEKLSPKLDPGGATDFLSALEMAHGQFKETDIKGRQPVILLLTDGKPDPARRDVAGFMDAYMESLWEAVGALAYERIPIYTVGFSDEIDVEVLRKFSRDTGGESYILEEPAGLVVTFFEVLADLKGRMSLLGETLELQNTSRSFSFPVDEYTRQVNLVAVNAAPAGADDLSIALTPPHGEARDIPELSVSGRDNYVLAILSMPNQEHYGMWELTVSGHGRVELMGNADLYLEAALLEPAPSSQHPLHEPMNFKVELNAREDFSELPFQVAVYVTAPDDLRPTMVTLAWEDGYFRGTYAPVGRQGDYRLQLQVLLEGVPVYSASTFITVKLLPVLTTDFWFGPEGFRLWEERVVIASLQAGGNRLPEGPHLQLNYFTLFFDYEDGQRASLDLFDDGDPEHGNVRAGDGIWSNRLVFEREGLARATLIAAGVYRETDFRLEKNFGEIFIGAAGTIAVAPAPGELTAVPGRRLLIPLTVENRSPFPEILITGEADAAAPDVTFTRQEFTLEPGEAAEITVAVALSRQLETGPYRLPLALSAAHPLTTVEPARLEQPLVLQTPCQYLWQRTLHGARRVLDTLWPLLLAALLLYGCGLLCYRLLVAPHIMLGYLTYWKVQGAGEEEPQKISLSRRSGTQTVVSFNPASPTAAFTIKGSSFSHDLIFSVVQLTRAPRFILGWLSLFGGVKEAWFRKKVQCTPPGVIEMREAAFTWKELEDGDQFISGGFFFHFHDAAARGSKKQDRGINLLEGKM